MSYIFHAYTYVLNVLKASPLSSTKLSMGKGFGSSKFKYAGKLTPGIQGPTLLVPSSIGRPDYADDGVPKLRTKGMPWDVTVQTPEDIIRMKKAGKIAREVLDAAVLSVKAGMTTMEIDHIVHEETIKRNSYPSPLNYYNFPKSCCTSINEVICHGIPDSTVIQDGDIMNIDVTIFHDGVHGDCSETVLVGSVSEKVKDLVVTTYNAWKAAINFCKPGQKYSDIGGVIEDIISPKGYTSVKEFCGHGYVFISVSLSLSLYKYLIFIYVSIYVYELIY